MKQKLIFCSIIFPGRQAEINSLLLAESIRTFGGAMAKHPLWFLMPDYGEPLTDAAQKRLQKLNVRVMPFDLERERMQFFFMGQLGGLSQAEMLSDGEAEFLAWMDANTILLKKPERFFLPEGKSFGYRPVHHLLLGSRFDQSLDPFWEQVYRSCHVKPEHVFPMKPVVEDIQMRPYFNSGLMVIRPERGLLRQWYQTFLELYQSPVFQTFYQQDQRYIIFMHQAVLAGVVLMHLEHEEILELPETYNYPAHLFEQDKTSHRPASIDDLVTLRHEGFFKDADWMQKITASDQLKQWLEKMLWDIRGE